MRDHRDLRLWHRIHLAQNFRALARHHHQPLAALADLVHDLALRRIWLAQQSVQRGHHRHAYFFEQRQQMTARRTAVDAKLMLHAQHIHIVEVQKVRRASIGVDILLHELKAHAWGILVALHAVIHRSHIALRLWRCSGHRLAHIAREGRDSTLTGNIVPEKSHPRE